MGKGGVYGAGEFLDEMGLGSREHIAWQGIPDSGFGKKRLFYSCLREIR